MKKQICQWNNKPCDHYQCRNNCINKKKAGTRRIKYKVYDTRYVKSGKLERFLVISFQAKDLKTLNKIEKEIIKKIDAKAK